MSENVWIMQSTLWAMSQDRAARELPRWTKAWWRKALEIYLGRGGKVQEDESEVDEFTSADPDNRAFAMG